MIYFTPDKKLILLKRLNKNELSPSDISIKLVKQFARTYFVASELKSEFKNFIIN